MGGSGRPLYRSLGEFLGKKKKKKKKKKTHKKKKKKRRDTKNNDGLKREEWQG